MGGVPMEVSGCDNNLECNWRYKWIKLTLKVSERDENGGWVKVIRKTNDVKTEVYKNEERRIQWRWRCLHVTLKAIILFVVQSTGSAPASSGSAQRGNVSRRTMCVTAKTTVATVLTKETAVSWCSWQWYWWWWNSSSVSFWCGKIYVSCLVHRFYDAENGVCLNCPVANSCDERSTERLKVTIKVNGRDENQWQW